MTFQPFLYGKAPLSLFRRLLRKFLARAAARLLGEEDNLETRRALIFLNHRQRLLSVCCTVPWQMAFPQEMTKMLIVDPREVKMTGDGDRGSHRPAPHNR